MSGVERSVLGAILVDGRVYEQADELRPDDFSLDSHRRIFTRMGDSSDDTTYDPSRYEAFK